MSTIPLVVSYLTGVPVLLLSRIRRKTSRPDQGAFCFKQLLEGAAI